MPTFRTYAQRRSSPFNGTVQVIEVADRRALSYEGWLWHTQLRSAGMIAERVWGVIGPRQFSRPFFSLRELDAGRRDPACCRRRVRQC